MKYHHCNVEEAIQIHKDINSKRSIGMHWGTFILTDEPMREPVEKLEQLTEQQNMSPEEFTVMQHGRTIKI
jgi:L-ascorbate metabolism protein UlaG (beta-lactamase superfamily)